jgi:hypothetical protein
MSITFTRRSGSKLIGPFSGERNALEFRTSSLMVSVLILNELAMYYLVFAAWTARPDSRLLKHRCYSSQLQLNRSSLSIQWRWDRPSTQVSSISNKVVTGRAYSTHFREKGDNTKNV